MGDKVKTSLAAYEYWLMGMEELKKGNVEADNAGREHFLQALEIDDTLIGDDREMLEDLVIAAFNDAASKVEQTVQEKFAGLTSGIGLPPGMNLPF